MKRGIVFSTARSAALVSITGAPLVVLAGAQPARAAGPHARPSVAVQNTPEFHDLRFLDFLDWFWRDAWGAPFALHQTGMSLEPADGPGPRIVLVHDGPEIVARGRYQEHVRHAVPGLDPAPVPSFSFHHYVTAGVVQGPGGALHAIYGLTQRVVFAPEEGDEIFVEGLTPLGVADTVDGAVAAALDTLNLLDFVVPDDAGDEPGLTSCLCNDIYFNELNACLLDAVACEAACGAAAIAALAACLAAGPLAGACMAAVLVAEVLCIANCLAKQRACNIRATNDWLQCLLDCAGAGG